MLNGIKMNLSSEGNLRKKLENNGIWTERGLSWHEFYKFNQDVHPVILTSEIEDFDDWLFLRGFRYPDPYHDAFDFSAYKTKDGRKILGLPNGIKVYSPLDGIVEMATTEYMWGADYTKSNVMKFGGSVTISHNVDFTMGTRLAHLTPTVKPGDYINRGQVVGIIHSSLDIDEGLLTHLHVKMGEIYPGSLQGNIPGPIDPIQILYPNRTRGGENPFDILELPHTGGFFREELEKIGIIMRYKVLLYCHELPGRDIHRNLNEL